MGLLLLVRHGQASFGADDYDVLSDAGHEQGRTLGRWLAGAGTTPASVVHGGLRRHRETWAAMAEGAGWDPALAEVDPDWDEFDHLAVIDRHPERPDGDLDRRAFQEFFEQATASWIAGAGTDYPESYDDFVVRARRALASAHDRPGPTVVVTSGGVIAAVAAALVVPPDDLTALGHVWGRLNTVTANSSVTRVIVGATGARLLTFNEHPHLGPELLTYR